MLSSLCLDEFLTNSFWTSWWIFVHAHFVIVPLKFQRRGCTSDCYAICILIGPYLLLSSVKGVNSHICIASHPPLECVMTVELFIDYCIILMTPKRLFAAWAVRAIFGRNKLWPIIWYSLRICQKIFRAIWVQEICCTTYLTQLNVYVVHSYFYEHGFGD